MRSSKIILSILTILGDCALTQRVSSQSLAQSKRIVIAASAVLDGKGHVLHDTRIVIGGSKIVAIDPKAGPVDYDLRWSRSSGGTRNAPAFGRLNRAA